MITIDTEKCIGCGKCAGDCVSASITVNNGKAIYSDGCIQCGHCVAICPVNAVAIPEYDMKDVDEYKDSFNLDKDQLLHSIKFRRSIRYFENKVIEKDKLENIIQAGRYTATAVNRQACHFTVVQDELDQLKKMIWDGMDKMLSTPEALPKEDLVLIQRLYNMYHENQTDYLFRNAPSVLYIAAENTIDAGLAAQNMELMAIAQGLGGLYNGYLTRITAQSKEICKWLGLENTPLVICMLLGYPDVHYMRTAPRKQANVRWL